MGISYSLSASGIAPSAAHPLYRWYRNYAKRFARPVVVACIGDSIISGSGVPAGSVPNRSGLFDTLPYQLQALLNGYPPQGRNDDEVSFVPYYPGMQGGYAVRTTALFDGGVPVPWRTPTGTATSIDRGIGMRCARINAASRISFTAPSATGFAWWFEDGASHVGQPAITIYAGEYSATRTGKYVDGYAQTMNTGLAQYARTWSAATLPSRGKYTIEFSPATGTPVIDMIYVFDGDQRQGVWVVNYALGATDSAAWAANNTQANTAADAIASLTAWGGVDLLVICLGANDYANTVNPATFQTNLAAIIDKYRAELSRAPAVLLVSHFARYDVTPTTYQWSQYQAAMKAVAVAKSETDYLDLTPFFPVSQAADTDDDLVDSTGVHLTTAGQAIAAQVIAHKLTGQYAI